MKLSEQLKRLIISNMKDIKIDDDTVNKFKEGNTHALEKIYNATSEMIYNVIYRIVLNEEDAKDLTQDVYVKAYEKRKTFNNQASISTWLYKIAVNMAFSLMRRKAFFKNIQTKIAQIFYEPYSQEKDFEDYTEDIEIIKSLLKKVKIENRVCLVLKEIENLSYQEIAETLKININTVKTRVLRGREELKSLYERMVKQNEIQR